MALTVNSEVPAETTLATTCTLLTRGTGVNWAEVNCTADFYVVMDNSVADGAAVPASARHRLPGNQRHVIDLRSKNVLIAAVSATPTFSAIGYSSHPLRTTGR